MPTAPSLLFLTVFEQTVSLETWMSKLSRFKSVEHGVLKSCFETLPEGKFKFLKKKYLQRKKFSQKQPLELFCKESVLKSLANSQENTCFGVSFGRPSGLQLFQNKTLAQLFSCEYCEGFLWKLEACNVVSILLRN